MNRESFLDNENSLLCIVMQYCSGGDLGARVKMKATGIYYAHISLFILIDVYFP